MLNKVIEILDANSEETRHPQWGAVRLFTEDAILAAAEQILTLLQPNDAGQPNGSKPIVSGSLPIASNDEYRDMAKEIVSSLKNAMGMQPSKVTKIDWKMLEGDWFDILKEKLGGNDR